MTRFGRCECQANGGGVAHLAHQNHIRVFAQCSPQTRLKVGGVSPYFTLMDQTLKRCMLVLDGIFKGQQVAFTMLVDVVQQGCKQG